MDNTVRNYVLKMKVRNKIGLKLSRWVGYAEIPKEILVNQRHHQIAQNIKNAVSLEPEAINPFLNTSPK